METVKKILLFVIFISVLGAAGCAETLHIGLMFAFVLAILLSVVIIFRIEEKELENDEISTDSLMIYHYDEDGNIINS